MIHNAELKKIRDEERKAELRVPITRKDLLLILSFVGLGGMLSTNFSATYIYLFLVPLGILFYIRYF